MSAKPTRREFFGTVGAALVAAACIPGCGLLGRERKLPARGARADATRTGQRAWSFRSRPDLSPPAVSVATRARGTAPGYVFVAPKKGGGQYGPMIVDETGQPVWFSPLPGEEVYATDFKVQSYRGEPVITWWEGRVVSAHGAGEYVVLDGSYREVARVPASDRYDRDLHEFKITPQNTALFTVYESVRMDLSSLGGLRDAVVFGGIIQEVDLETGEVIFEWHSLDHVGLDESYRRPAKSGGPLDYFHINSIDVEPDGNLLISARLTSTVYKIDRGSGEVVWRLGGKKSDFEMGEGTRTVFQHDARRLPNGTVTIFDNRAMKKEHSRGIVLELDEEAMTATLVREYAHPDGVWAATQGNMQTLPNGNVFVGWGSEPPFSEFGGDGELLFDASFPPGSESYRAYRFEWVGRPDGTPEISAGTSGDGEVKVYASWNGATEVADWEALSGPAPERLQPVGKPVPRGGFETGITARTREAYVAARARDASGRVLGVSRAIRPA